MEERVELKFLVNYSEYHNLSRQLDLFMQKDEHATHDRGYVLSSLYFDDMYDSATFDKADGVEYHRKFRIRSYENNSSRLEFKNKNGNITAKDSVFLNDELKQALIDRNYGVIQEYLEQPLIGNIFLKMKMDNLQPRLYIDYFREIYIFAGDEVRVTFDSDITAYTFFNPDQKYKILEPGTIIMEVKYRKYLPDAVRKIVFSNNYEVISYSKYLMGWLKINNWGV